MNHTRQRIGLRIGLFAAALVSLVALAGGCGGDDDEGAGNPDSRAADYDTALADAPKPLADLYARGNELIDGGLDAFRTELAELRGHPVVVNLWASWCGPCRFEFPHFQSQAAEHGEDVAFLGVDTEDSEDAARTFLEEFPVPYPSVSDPDSEVKGEVGAVGLPVTAFYGSNGELRYTKQGPYSDEADLAADIERYAR